MTKSLAILFALLPLAACSSGGGGSAPSDPEAGDNGGNESPVSEAPSSEAEEIARAAADTAINSIASTGAPDVALPVPGATAAKYEYLATLPVGPKQVTETTLMGDCGGSLYYKTTSETPDDAQSLYPMTIWGEQIYTDYCSADVTFSGTVDFTSTYLSATEFEYATTMDFVYENLLGDGQSHPLKYSQTCTYGASTITCTDGTWYEAADGSDYQLTESVLSGDSSSGYELTGTFIIEGDQNYQLIATGLSLCDNGHLGTGSIELLYNGSAYMKIEFTSCYEYTYQFESVSYIGGY